MHEANAQNNCFKLIETKTRNNFNTRYLNSFYIYEANPSEILKWILFT